MFEFIFTISIMIILIYAVFSNKAEGIFLRIMRKIKAGPSENTDGDIEELKNQFTIGTEAKLKNTYIGSGVVFERNIINQKELSVENMRMLLQKIKVVGWHDNVLMFRSAANLGEYSRRSNSVMKNGRDKPAKLAAKFIIDKDTNTATHSNTEDSEEIELCDVIDVTLDTGGILKLYTDNAIITTKYVHSVPVSQTASESSEEWSETVHMVRVDSSLVKHLLNDYNITYTIDSDREYQILQRIAENKVEIEKEYLSQSKIIEDYV